MLLLTNQLHLIHLAGNRLSLHGHLLIAGTLRMLICGCGPAFGVGLFPLVESLLFVLGMSPLAAFPIMTTAGALQQPMTTIALIKNHKAPPVKTIFYLSAAGLVAVFLMVHWVIQINSYDLRWALLCVITYNLAMLLRTALKKDREEDKKAVVTI